MNSSDASAAGNPDSVRQFKKIAKAFVVAAVVALVMAKNMPPDLGIPKESVSMLSVHLLMELFAIIIALLVVAVTWNTLEIRYERPKDIFVCGFVVVAACDLAHALTYAGMPAFFGPTSTQRAVTFWLMGRGVEVTTMTLIALRVSPQLPRRVWLISGLCLSAALIWLGSYRVDLFPVMFVEGVGVTPVKTHIEEVLCGINLIVAWMYWLDGNRTNQRSAYLLALSSFVMGVGEIMFTSYKAPSDFQNVFGHTYKLLSYALLYAATVATSLRKPFAELTAAESLARMREQSLRTLSDNLPDAVVYQFVRPRVGKAYCNYLSDSARHVYGVEAAVLMQDPDMFNQMVVAEDRRRMAAAVAQSRRQLAPIQIEVTIARPDGERRCISINAAPRQSGSDDVMWDGVATDITERKQAEIELDRTRLRLQSVIDTAMDAIVTADASQTIISVNASALKMFRCTEDQLLGEHLRILMPQRFWSRHDEHVRHFMASGNAVLGSGMRAGVVGVRFDGEEFPADVSVSHQTIAGEHLLTAILSDITQRKRAEDEIRALNSNLETQVRERTSALQQTLATLQVAHEEMNVIFETATVGIVLIRDQTILRCNRKLETLYNMPSSGFNGRSTRLLFSNDEEFQTFNEHTQGSISQGRACHQAFETMRQGGEHFWASLTATPLTNVAGDGTLMALIEDLTPQREAQRAIVQAKEQAEAANRAKSNFLANMSHEIRTPMNAILGMAYLVLKHDLNPQLRDYLRKIQSSSQHLLGIINDILDYSKIEAGKMEVEHIEFDLDRVLDNVVSLIGDKAASKGLSLVFHIDQDVPNSLVGDPLRLGQILINYANNAVKFTSRGEIDIQIGVREQNDSDVLLYVAVRDIGVGLSAEQASHLFESFQQADSSTTREFGGTGLGLAICKQLSALMDGEVGVQSRPGEGSTFWFTARLQRGKPVVHPHTLKGSMQSKRVMVVDDNDTARGLLSGLLESIKLSCTAISSGTAALAQIQAADDAGTPYSIAFLDWQMPQMNGIELAQLIRSRGLKSPPQIVLVTGYGREEVMKSAEDAGILNLLVKPINASTLFDTVMKLLEEKVPGEEVTASVPPDQQATSQNHLRGASVLLVEDNMLNQEVARELLQDEGVLVDLADNGEAALQMVQSKAYDLVLMDVQMPVMDGLTASRLMRQIPALAKLPIVAMTAHATLEDRAQCIGAGMNDHVAKPIEPQALLRTLLKWIVLKPSPPGLLPKPVATTTQSRSGEVSLPHIDGLDTVAGLRHLRGKRDVYVQFLQRFVNNEASTPQRLGEALAAGDQVVATRLAHTLKGNAATIGLNPVRDAAAALELAIRHGGAEAQLQPKIDLLAELLDNFSQALVLSLSLNGTEPPVQAIDSVQAVALCRQLLSLVEDNDLEAADLLHQHQEAFKTILGQHYDSVADTINQYDFDTARDLLIAATQPL
jgi:two-component system sensor histidine kinase/response regulator